MTLLRTRLPWKLCLNWQRYGEHKYNRSSTLTQTPWKSIVSFFFQSKNKTILYSVACTLVNCTNSYEKKDILPELVQLAKFSKQHVPEQHPKVEDWKDLLHLPHDQPQHPENRLPILYFWSHCIKCHFLFPGQEGLHREKGEKAAESRSHVRTCCHGQSWQLHSDRSDQGDVGKVGEQWWLDSLSLQINNSWLEFLPSSPWPITRWSLWFICTNCLTTADSKLCYL